MAADAGLYDISDGVHPKILPHDNYKVTLRSQANDNHSYYLQVETSHRFPKSCSDLGLMAGNQLIHFNGEGEGSGRFTLDATVTNVNLIPQITADYHATILNRHHPGHQMLVEFIPNQEEFVIGDPVVVTLRITNIGTNGFAFMQGGRQRGMRDNQFAFTSEFEGKMVPDSGDPMNFGGLAMAVKLKPGENHEISVDLTKWFKFAKAGIYSLRGSYSMDFINPEAKEFETIWEDFACAEFLIRVRK